MKRFDTTALRKEIFASGGYSEDVLDDEVHAYSISGGRSIKVEIPNQMKEELIDLFKKTSLL